MSAPPGEPEGGAAGRSRLIRELLGGPEYERLFRAVRRRVERVGLDRARSVTLRGLSEPEQRAVADLFGRPTVSAAPQIRLEELDRVLRESRVGAGLTDVLEALGGPLVDERAQKEERRAIEEAMWSAARAHPAVAGRPALGDWLEEIRARGLLKRAAQTAGAAAGDVLAQALEVASRLPAGGVLLSVLAAEVCEDAHALDAGRPLAGLVLRAAAHLAGWPRVPEAAPERRRLWAEVGVLCDPISSQALVLGLRPRGAARLARRLRAAADAGEPQRITLRELTRDPLDLAGAPRLFVCENPSVVAAAADRLGAGCAPLVCVEGLPSTAALELLDAARAAGAEILVHADFDWNGVRIANLVMESAGAAPWRAAARDYRAASRGAAGPPLSDRGAAARWDPDLEPAMREVGRAVYEESVLGDLLADLEGPISPR